LFCTPFGGDGGVLRPGWGGSWWFVVRAGWKLCELLWWSGNGRVGGWRLSRCDGGGGGRLMVEEWVLGSAGGYVVGKGCTRGVGVGGRGRRRSSDWIRVVGGCRGWGRVGRAPGGRVGAGVSASGLVRRPSRWRVVWVWFGVGRFWVGLFESMFVFCCVVLLMAVAVWCCRLGYVACSLTVFVVWLGLAVVRQWRHSFGLGSSVCSFWWSDGGVSCVCFLVGSAILLGLVASS